MYFCYIKVPFHTLENSSGITDSCCRKLDSIGMSLCKMALYCVLGKKSSLKSLLRSHGGRQKCIALSRINTVLMHRKSSYRNDA